MRPIIWLWFMIKINETDFFGFFLFHWILRTVNMVALSHWRYRWSPVTKKFTSWQRSYFSIHMTMTNSPNITCSTCSCIMKQCYNKACHPDGHHWDYYPGALSYVKWLQLIWRWYTCGCYRRVSDLQMNCRCLTNRPNGTRIVATGNGCRATCSVINDSQLKSSGMLCRMFNALAPDDAYKFCIPSFYVGQREFWLNFKKRTSVKLKAKSSVTGEFSPKGQW